MSITHVAPRYFPALGGVEEVVKRCAEIQAGHGHNVSVITSNLIRPGTRESLPVGPDLHQGVQIFRCPAWVLNSGRFYFIERGVLRALRRSRPDVIHLHANKCYATDLVAAWCTLTQRKFVFSPYAGKLGSSLAGRIHDATLGRLAFSASIVHIISESEGALIKQHVRAPMRQVLIPPGLDHEELGRVEFDTFKKWRIAEGRVILGVGRLEDNKGFDVLMGAFSRVRRECSDVRLVIVGEDFGVRRDLERQAEALGVASAVTFAGRLPRPELVSAFQHCTVFCHPARTEGFGVVVAEAMAAGAPVICSRIPVLEEFAGLGERGLTFEPENEVELASQLLRLLRDSTLRSRLSTLARQFAGRFSWECTASRLEELYFEILGS